jgi:hypothetical protein
MSKTRHIEDQGPLSPSVAPQRRRRLRRSSLRLEPSSDVPNQDAHLSFMREFLAPLLAEEFLRARRSAEAEPTSEAILGVTTSTTSYKEVGRKGHQVHV